MTEREKLVSQEKRPGATRFLLRVIKDEHEFLGYIDISCSEWKHSWLGKTPVAFVFDSVELPIELKETDLRRNEILRANEILDDSTWPTITPLNLRINEKVGDFQFGCHGGYENFEYYFRPRSYPRIGQSGDPAESAQKSLETLNEAFSNKRISFNLVFEGEM